MPKKEEPLYKPIRSTLIELFNHLGDCHLEITADKRFSNNLKRQFSKDTLYITRVEGFFPDITGFVRMQYATDLVTVEVKAKRIAIKDVFQAKEQAEIFDAKYALLVSPKTIPEEIRRFVKDRSCILNYSYNRRVVIAQFNEATEEFEIDKELYYQSLPEPFKTAYKPTVYFFDPNASKENIVGHRIIVKAKKAYRMGGWVDDLVREGKVAYSLEKLEVAGITYKDWLLKHGFKEILRPPTKEELDP